MPVLTIHDRLNPGPAPDVPPQAALPTTEFIQWMNISRTSAGNWVIRGTGPARTMHKNRRATYRVADVLHWLEGEGSPTGDARVKAFIGARRPFALCLTALMPGGAGEAARASLMKLEGLGGVELAALTAALDRVVARERMKWPKAVSVGKD